MKKKNIVLKGILLFIIVGVIIGIIYQKNYTSISDETIISTRAESKKFDQSEVISTTSIIDNLLSVGSIGTFDITLTANTNGYGSVSLDWNKYDYANKNFKVYKSTDGGITYESVGIDYASIKEVNVLQVYPDAGAGQLQSWLVDSGYGQGIIKVGEVAITEFNKNPTSYLYETSNGWNYDVIFFGTWDRNNYRDLSEASYNVVNNFAKSGKGIIFGHDVALNNGKDDILEYTGGTVKASQNYFNSLAIEYMPLLYYLSGQEISGTEVEIIRKGLFTTYPNYIGEIGTLLTIPSCHSWGQRVKEGYESNIWLNYTSSDVYGGGNFYLVSYNNFAMIQTGHSNGAATIDEQKILANLTFYMNQLLFNTYTTNDTSAQDLASPNAPIATLSGNQYSFSATDNGSTYSYYVESYDKNDTTETGLLAKSTTKSLTVTTGVKSYRYIYDNSATTTVTASIGTSTTSDINIDSNYKYLHVAAVDGAGNISNTTTIEIPQNANYKVYHQQEQLDGSYIIVDTETLNGKSATSVTPSVKTYSGFTSPATQTVTVNADGTTSVTYKYTRNTYTVILSKGTGISSVSGNGSYKYGASVSIDANSTTGYTWSNWTGTIASTTKAYTFTMPAANVTSTANAIANTYTIKYNGNGATGGSTANSTHTYDTAKSLTTNGYERKYTVTYNHNYTGSTNTSKTATYAFKNWNTVAGGAGTSYDNNASVVNLSSNNGATVNLYAQWTSSSVTYVPTRTGYIFGGWYTDSACTNQVASTNGVYTPTANVTLYAKWTPITYTVKYNGNGATGGNTANSSHTYDVAKNLTTNGYERKYTVTYNHNYTESTNTSKIATYSFAGWSKSTDGVKVYDNVASVINLTSTNNGTVNLYAAWNSASVSYIPTRAGYRFAGWYSEAECTNKVSDGTYTPTANITLYAKWEIDESQTKDLRYTVEYYKDNIKVDEDTQIVETTVQLLQPDILTVDKTSINTTNKYEGYRLEKTDPVVIPDTIETDSTIKVYYVKRSDLSYTVKYLEKDTNKELSAPKTVGNQIFESTVTEQAIEIEGYDKVAPIEKSIQIAVSGNEIIFYYTKRTDLSYTVKYLEQDSNKELANKKVVEGQTYESTVTEQAIGINGYNKVAPTEKSIQIAVSGNEIIFYYTKRTDLSYTVRYLEQDTNKELASAKIIGNQIFESTVTEQAIDINGYNKVAPTEKSIQIAVSGNEITFYYTKRTDLSYTVRYLEKDTNKELASAKIIENQMFESTVTEQAIEIEGYDKVEPIEKSIQIAVTGNEIIFYYTKRRDLSYTVRYLEQDTNKELASAKIIGNQIFESTVTERAIDINGYDKVEPTEKSIQIAVTGNEIIFYYTKRTDLSYIVRYLEQDTNIELASEKTVGNQTFESTVKENAIEINGYDKVDPTEKSIQIAVTGNEIIFYYTKRVDLSYTVNYLEKDTNKELANAKIVNNQRFKDEIITNNEVIAIYGYKLDSIDKEILTIETTENVINIYYVIDEAQTKDLSYTVEYYINGEKQEDDTVVITETVQVLKPDTLPMKQELIEENKYIGYEIDTTKEIPEIVNNGGVVEIHYKNKTFGYKVKYYFNGYVDEALTEEKSAKYLDVIDTYEDKIKEGYIFDEVQNCPLTVTEKEEKNVIKVYYKTNQAAIKEVTYEILYYKDGVVVDRRTVTRRVQVLLPDKIAVDKTLVETDKYADSNFIKTEPEEIPDLIESGKTISVYYESKISQVVVKIVDKVTGEVISEEIIEGKVGDTYSIEPKEIEGYTLIESPELTGRITEESQEKVFYYAKNAEVKVKYLEKDTENVLLDEEKIVGYEDKEYETTGKEIENYELVETIGIPSGTMSAGSQEVIYYYAQKAKVTVNHIDIISGETLETETIDGKVGDEYTTSSKDFEGYILETEPENATGVMAKDEIVVNYYYKHVSAGVIVKHIDKVSGEILDNEIIEGNEGDEYTTNPENFEGYDLEETLLPENSQGTMTKELIEVKYYYTRKTQVKVQYLDRNTLEEIATTEIIEGHEGDAYSTTPKEIEEYYLIESMLPENNEGTMTKEEITVTYYYAKKSAGVMERHIDEKTEVVIEEKLHEGLIGDDYKISSKEFEGYDLDITRLPENAEGKMTEELIEVNYYYIRKAQVKVEHIDENTNEVLETEIIEGHEEDSYKTDSKEIKGYVLDKEKLPENSTGIMTVTVNEDGTVTSEIVVKYYYKKISAGVLEKHIDIKTNDVLEEKFHSGNVGDSYKINSKEYEEYDLVEKDAEENSKLPENAEGTMTEELIEVNYYYIRKATVRVEYVDSETGKKVSEDTIIEGHEDDEYKTEAKEIKDYTLNKDKLPENSEGTMKVVRSEYFIDEVNTETVVTYYYDKVKKTDESKKPNNTEKPSEQENNNNNNGNNNSNNSNNSNGNNNSGSSDGNGSNNGNSTIIKILSNNNNSSSTSTTQNNKATMPSTGDVIPVIAITAIILVAIANIVQIIINKRKKE